MKLLSCVGTIISTSTFVGNVARQQRGAISNVLNADNGVWIDNSTFENNSALDGGALHGDNNAQYQITGGSVLRNNSAVLNGGVLYCDNCWNVIIDSSSMYGNTAAAGGAIFCESCELLMISYTSLEHNK